MRKRFKAFFPSFDDNKNPALATESFSPASSSPCLRTSCPSNASLATCAALPPTKSTLMSSTQASTEAFGCRAANGPMNDRGYHKFGHQQSGWAAC